MSALNYEKKKLIAVYFKTFALLCQDRNTMDSAERYMSILRVGIETFHPNELVTEEEFKSFMGSFNESLELHSLTLYLQKHSMNLVKSIEVVMLLYMHGKHTEARTLRNEILQKLPGDDLQHNLKFNITTAMFELRYGMIKKAKKYLENVLFVQRNNPNVLCAQAECDVYGKHYRVAAEWLNKIIGNLNLIMNPSVQKLLHTYFEDWKVSYKIDMLTILMEKALL